jgi:hypothetical protein
MTVFRLTRILAVASLLVTMACSSSPTAPSIANVSGVWSYVSTITSASGGECVAPFFPIGGITRGTFSVTQNGATLSATSRQNDTGITCQYSGTAGTSTIALSFSSCNIGGVGGVLCANGARRDVLFATDTLNLNVNGSQLSGTEGQTMSVTVAGTNTGVGLLTFASQWTATR